ncbi:MAG: hypothetical protein ABI972_04860 [Acidobacteriota bacterium]
MAFLAKMLQAQPLAGTSLLSEQGDQAALMLDGIHSWLDHARVETALHRDVTDVRASRAELERILGVRGNRIPFDFLDAQPVLGVVEGIQILAARWPVLKEARAELTAEGLYLRPAGQPKCYVVALPDAEETPNLEHALRLAAGGCGVIVPVLIDRDSQWSGTPGVKSTKQPHREFVYRMAYQMGRHIIGYEVEKVLAAVDWMSAQNPRAPVGVMGKSEGALIALLAGALDERIQSVGVAGLGPRDSVSSEPLYRNVFGLLKRFGDAQLAQLISPRHLVRSEDGLSVFAKSLGVRVGATVPVPPLSGVRDRQQRQFAQMVEFTQALVRAADGDRKHYWSAYKPADPATLEPYRERFAEWIGKLPGERSLASVRSRQAYDTPAFRGYEVKLPVTGEVFAYGVLLVPKDLKPGERRPLVVAQHGLEGRPQLLVDAGSDEYSRDTYREFAARLAERGYIVYAPQNPYILGERFRQAQRKANPLGLTLFSFIVAQHERTLDWLKTLPMADPERIGFYGLSYGGFTAMRVPALLKDYKAVVCSGNFNEWTWKTTSIDAPFSYMFTPEYEIPEFAQGTQFGHFEMAQMIAPRPFMVERGHRDGVGIDEWVAYEYAKVARHYRELGIPERTELEYFDGIHRINGEGTFRFLDRWLNWVPRQKE